MLRPTFGQFDLESIAEVFEERLGDRSEAIDLAFRYGQRRLRELVIAAAERTLVPSRRPRLMLRWSDRPTDRG